MSNRIISGNVTERKRSDEANPLEINWKNLDLGGQQGLATNDMPTGSSSNCGAESYDLACDANAHAVLSEPVEITELHQAAGQEIECDENGREGESAAALSQAAARELALRYLKAGLAIIPVTEGKKPSIPSWKQYQKTPPSEAEIDAWIRNGCVLGYGVLAGKVSGNLEVIDVDDCTAKEQLIKLLSERLPNLLPNLPMVDTPKGGLHIYYRCQLIEGNQKLAWEAEESERHVLIETRGEGGYVVGPGSHPRVHPLNKEYQLRQGDLSAIPQLTPDERETLLEIARSLNREFKPSLVDEPRGKNSKSGGDSLRPGDDFNTRVSWDDVLGPHGWTKLREEMGEVYWTRPGKTSGTSATTNYVGSDLLVVFTTSTPFNAGTSYSKFAAYTVLNHGGDFGQAAADLAALGYGTPEDVRPPKTQSAILLRLAADVELFNFNDEAYATVTVKNHEETYRVNSGQFKRWLQYRFYSSQKTTASASPMEEALQALSGKALFDGDTQAVSLRVAGDRTRIYLDLGDPDWRVVEIDAGGWRLLDRSPVKFVRSSGMKPLPTPTLNGSLNDLRSLVNVTNDQDWLLLLSWLEYSFTPFGCYPVLAISGEQGSAKSTTCEMLRRLVDNNKSLLRSLPKDAQNLAVSAKNSWLLAFDNLSGVKAEMSDLLCAVSTGGGFATRKLYENDEEVLLDFCRPILLNGISDLLTRADLLDRTISINLPRIDEARRRCEDDVWGEFDAKEGGILGALLTVISQGIARSGQVQLPNKPRMADFAVFGAACERANGFKDGEFLAAYNANVREAQDGLVGGDLLAATLLEYLEANPEFTGTYRTLLARLSERTSLGARDPFFPKSPQALSNALKRLAAGLRNRGVEIRTLPRGHGGVRPIHIKKG